MMAKESTFTPRKQTEMAPLSLEGQTLGKYRILEPLGRGGMAQVFKAYHPGLDRYVAIKILRSDLVEEQEFLARFTREARAVAALRHPNIVQIFDFDTQEDMYYMVMELLEGDTLKAYLNYLRVRGERMPLGEVARIFSDVLAGLAYAHNQGIIHRDLKPANIMLTRAGQAVLTDFGIAQIVGGTQYTVSGALMGTLSYMAPEQGLQGRCDVTSDIYSLGIAYYEALTGSVPFDADTPLAILMKHVNDPLPLPRAADPTIPESFERVALKSLAKQPQERYQSAAEMSEALVSAARTAGVEIPDTISLPSNTASLTNHGPVAIFSGAARKTIPDAGFASDDTDISPVTTSRMEKLPLTTQVKTFFTRPQQPEEVHRTNVGRSVLLSVGGLVFLNIIMLWLSGIYGWKIYSRCWPLEILSVGILLSAIMASLATPWMLIPAGIVMGNGVLLSYFAMSGMWKQWTYLWPLEPLMVAVSIVAPFWFARQGTHGNWLARRLGILLIVLAIIVMVVSLMVGIARP